MATPASDLIAIVDPTTDLIEIVDSPLNLTKYTDHVRCPAAGAVATFEGTTRDTFNGRRVLRLSYESYTPMARRQLQLILDRARSQWDLIRVAVAHRIGTVPVGEASVFVAASSVHRAEAMEACRFVIDEVKARVPIWKKEVYENGEVWKENREFFETLEGEQGKVNCGCRSKVRVEEEEEEEGKNVICPLI